MTDMILARPAKQSSSSTDELKPGAQRSNAAEPTFEPVLRGTSLSQPNDTLIEMIELLFFAYRDFIGDPDAILDEFAFGRAHHRVLYFVNRSPGLTVAELLDILKITKQSLGRVLRDLIEAGFILQQTGATDRRQRLLFPTPRGEALAQRLTEPQMRRISAALAALGPEAGEVTSRFLRLMINEQDRISPVAPKVQP